MRKVMRGSSGTFVSTLAFPSKLIRYSTGDMVMELGISNNTYTITVISGKPQQVTVSLSISFKSVTLSCLIQS